MKIEVIESIANAKQYYAVTIDGQCNHGGEMVEEDVEDDNPPHRVVRCAFCDRCGAQYDDFNNDWIENLSSRSHAQNWVDWLMNGGEMPKFYLGEPIVNDVIAETM